MKYSDKELNYYVDIITKIAKSGADNRDAVKSVLNSTPLTGGKSLSKANLLEIYQDLKKMGLISLRLEEEKTLLNGLKKKFIRSLSGVTTVTVLTMPYPCPGKCIFCPNDIRMPKSYIASEPGAQRALANKFDPYLQTYNRLVALSKNGHPVDKIEMIVLGGTWTFYPENYRRWFILRCFQALNDFDGRNGNESLSPAQVALPIDLATAAEYGKNKEHSSYNHVVAKNITLPDVDCTWDDLDKAFVDNEQAYARCVGLSLETRPDEINENTVIELRKLGATKIQMGVQALDDVILSLNKRGHTVAVIANAFKLLRLAGFKIQVHWMPNLYGSNPQKDLEMFFELFSNVNFKPDELKIYPCSLIPGTELEQIYENKKWAPYDEKIMLGLIVDFIKNTPRYCRITRVIRDIPSNEIAAGNGKTNLRQDAELILEKEGTKVVEIRSREIREKAVDLDSLVLKETFYSTSISEECFLEFVTLDDKLAGFLRLSLPSESPTISELSSSAVIREIHVYGQSLSLGTNSAGKAQHSGLGKRLIQRAEEICLLKGYSKLSVISAIGTREYYRKRGFRDGQLYQYKFLS
ncbi:tRNA uridine(34) 5-carboxymethylaminomethyl modification radical SAM/GNAT enzyme Elp3 [candidate division WWE3 bacterium]|uniref:tRNA carboxymethyluridine synthase n=1 Tax=candidate division WWE3 bacterium TaxID=2053526 RepID=A0A7X9DKP8_UNCKA|nr:tRNA uridine(34) 5-carboxymethylaminomethyl modification radical SAM/GNAT enzyme Elp3 [candidate division WWE3 bacterium]